MTTRPTTSRLAPARDLDAVFDELVRRLSTSDPGASLLLGAPTEKYPDGQTCFSFTQVDDGSFVELDALTARGGKLDAERGFLR